MYPIVGFEVWKWCCGASEGTYYTFHTIVVGVSSTSVSKDRVVTRASFLCGRWRRSGVVRGVEREEGEGGGRGGDGMGNVEGCGERMGVVDWRAFLK